MFVVFINIWFFKIINIYLEAYRSLELKIIFTRIESNYIAIKII